MICYRINFYVLIYVFIFVSTFLGISRLKAVEEIHTFKLYNGLEFYLIKNNNPVINFATWVKVGGIDENRGKQGVAHFVEHMMFKDNKKYTGTKFTKILQSTGGQYNAFTNYDFTVYHHTITSSYLSLIMKLESSRLQGLAFKKDQFEEERKVILEERGLRIDNNPLAKYMEYVNYYMFPASNYGRSLIGSVKSIESITLDEVKSFYNTYYVPHNIKIFVIGNVSFKQFKSLALKHYKNIPKAREINKEYNLVGETNYKCNSSIVLKCPNVVQPIYSISYLAPALRKDNNLRNVLALVFLQNYLSSKTNIFFNKLVKEKGLVNSLSVNYHPLSRLNTNFSIYFIPKENISFAKIKQEVELILDDIAKNGINKEELKTLCYQLKDQITYTKDNESDFLLLFANLIMLGFTPQDINDGLDFFKQAYDYEDLNGYILRFLHNNTINIELIN